jgi:Holliday junction resolvasome RuvABC ATP-dependent DNA helicase subunit
METRVVEVEKFSFEQTCEVGLRPSSFDEYIGQEKIKENLQLFIKVAPIKGIRDFADVEDVIEPYLIANGFIEEKIARKCYEISNMYDTTFKTKGIV